MAPPARQQGTLSLDFVCRLFGLDPKDVAREVKRIVGDRPEPLAGGPGTSSPQA